MSETNMMDQLIKEAERVHESAMYSAQTQFEYSKSWRFVDRWLSGGSAIMAAIAGVGALSEVVSSAIAGVVALGAAGLGAVASSLGAPKTKTAAHAAANAYLALQQDARIFINVDVSKMSYDDARQALSSLVARQQELNTTAEIPSVSAWKKAKKSVESGFQEYEADK
ncbi:MAG: hypothetical protein JWN28_374 [Candidatus Saccharibacteria bacterium]|nr:hypothetical protein [Candidatus Saccharibacteria bacterium]